MIAGSDEYLGTMTLISSADTVFATTVQAADAAGVAGKTTALPWNIGGASLDAAVYNANAANANGGVWDITAVTSSEWIIGAAKLAGLLRFTMATAADWTDAQSVMTICTP
jgi:hypothetical protein